MVIVHNGIIENYQEIKEALARKGYTFSSQTDTEVAAALLDSYYVEAGKKGLSPRERALDAIRNMMIRVPRKLCAGYSLWRPAGRHLRDPQGQPAHHRTL